MVKRTYFQLINAMGGDEKHFAKITGISEDIVRKKVSKGRLASKAVTDTVIEYIGSHEFVEYKHKKTIDDMEKEVLKNLGVKKKESLSDADEDRIVELLTKRNESEKVRSLRKDISILERKILSYESDKRVRNYITKSNVVINWRTQKEVRNEKTAILFSSDFQAGEVINYTSLDNSNTYNKHIFSARYMTMISKFIETSAIHGQTTGCIYLRGGDAISGGIHGELKDTDDLTAIEAVSYVARLEIEGIKKLLDFFGKVFVISIPGNHGRAQNVSGMGNRCKGYVEHNYETLIADFIASHFEGNDNVNFMNPLDGRAVFDVYGLKFLMTHGDRMAGGAGPKGVSTGHEKEIAFYASAGVHIDVVLTGHYHTSMKLPTGFANGTMAGYGEYARDMGLRFDYPKQWMFIVEKNNNKGKICFSTEIILG